LARGKTFAAFSAITAAESPSLIICYVEYGIGAGAAAPASASIRPGANAKIMEIPVRNVRLSGVF
jgi:hypothetical protein